jgi:putative salt-induced outer membrane protein YdiY
MIRKLGFLTISLCLFASVCWADQVILKNGDTLTGTIEKLTDSKMVFKSELAGEVTIDLSGIRTLTSDKLLTIHLKDGTVLKCQVDAGQGEQFNITGSAVQAQSINTTDITAINPPPKPRPKWKGQVSAGLTSAHGNTKTESSSASFGAIKRTEVDRTTVSADYAKGTQDNAAGTTTIEDWWRAKAKYDYFISPKWYGFVDGRYERDAVALLDRRMVLGGGAGWQWLETETTSWSFELGAASVYEQYNVVGGKKNAQLSMQTGYNLIHQLTKTVDFVHDLTYYPSLEDVSDYYLTTGAELRTRFTTRMFGNFKTLFNYDATPAPGKGSTDVKYIVGVGFDF